MSPNEFREVLVEWNDTRRPYAVDKSICALFEDQAALTPDSTAVVFGTDRLTYRELNERTNQLGHFLRELGVKPDTLVSVCLERSLELVVALLAILKAGGAYLPLDPSSPIDRLRFMTEDAGSPVLVTTAPRKASLPAVAAITLCVDEEPAAWSTRSKEKLPTIPSLAHVAYAIYTSGSTGQPKGVLNTHRGILNRLLWMQEAFGLQTSDVVLQKTPYTFDVSVWEFFWPLMFSAKLVVAPPDAHREPRHLVQLIEAEGVTTTHFVPSMLGAFLEQLRPGDCPSLRRVICSGEALTPDLVERFFDRAAACELHNLYGPTEAAVDVSWWRCERGARVVRIGRPIANTQLYVLDHRLEPVPVGVYGELHIAGVQLARGYVNRPDLTAERFVPNPYGPRGSRLYCTGDLVRWLSDGTIEFVGRRDFQIKIRGFRIELGEIEAALRRHPAVRECVVVARVNETLGPHLVAYVAPGDLDTPSLRETLRSKLPEYMLPAAFVTLEAFPLTTNGKLDRKALPEPDFQRASRNFVAPQTPLENTLSAVWCSVLRIERAGIHDNFFELGGHSLLATQVISRIRHQLSVELPVRALFEAPTVAGLAEEIQRRGVSDARLSEPAIVAVSRDRPLPLSSSETSLWFLDQYRPGVANNLADALRLRGPLDRRLLARATEELVARHESLRTRFVAEAGEPRRIFDPPHPVVLECFDLSAEPATAGERELAALRLLDARIAKPFDVARGPVFCATLVRLGSEDHVLLLAMHHMVADGWSTGVLWRDLGALYEAFGRGERSLLPEQPLQYADYAAWERTTLRAGRVAEQVSYWREHLAGVPWLELPTDRPRPPVQSTEGATYTFELDLELTKRLKALGQREGATLFMTLLGAFAVLLSRYAGQKDFAIGTLLAHRTRVELESLVGLFLNTLALRLDLSGVPTVRQLLARARREALDAHAHQDVPIDRVLEELQLPRDQSRPRLFQVMFILQNAPPVPGSLAEGLRAEPFPLTSEVSDFDLTLVATERQSALSAAFVYPTGLFDLATIERMAAHLHALLEGMVNTPDARVADLPMISPAERDLLSVWSRGPELQRRDRCIHELFEEQAALHPDAIAVESDDGALTYRQLQARADGVANALRARGVGPERFVGVALERSLDLPVALLGILKAGGAYVPIDLDLPPERVAFMLQDAAPAVVVSHSTLAPRLKSEKFPLLLVDEIPESKPFAVARLTPDNAAYVIYTSGSTGLPKSVVIPHRGVVNHLAWMQSRFPMTPGDRALQMSATSFDASVWELFGPLAYGATMVLAAPAGQRDPAYLVATLRKRRITHIEIVPSMLRMVMATPGFQECSALRYVMSMAEGLPRSLGQEFVSLHRATLVNTYGPSECTIDTCCFVWRTADALPVSASDLVPIGRPLDNVEVHVLDDGLQPVGVGLPGELFVGGRGLGRCYLNRPELTAERFVPDPFSPEPGARLYRTGDRVRYLGDGNLEFLGRVDHQVKIRGFRVELGEIESALLQQPRVTECVVTVREDDGERRLVAYSAPADVSAEVLRTGLRSVLPAYMIPAAFVGLERLPRTASGKVDRKALPAPERKAALEGYVAPTSTLEEQLVAIWKEVLRGVDVVGIHDNFFELGGHSLLATQVTARIHKQLGLELPVRALFDAPTVAGLAEHVIVAQLDAASPEELAELLSSVEHLSAEEVAREIDDGKRAERAAPTNDAGSA